MARPISAAKIAEPPARRPIVTLTTDFGTRDFYVPAMKAVLLRNCPEARLIDISHDGPRHDILCGSIMLERAVDGFPPGTVHLAVIDPGVGTSRRILIVEINEQLVVCPDNGLITWVWRRRGPGTAYDLMWRPKHASHVFHGRDIMAPIAAKLAGGQAVASVARPIDDPILLKIAPAKSPVAEIIHLDHFGNATTNLTQDTLRAFRGKLIAVRGKTLGKLRRTYWDVAPGKPLALIGSSGLLEIAVRDGSAADDLGLQVGDEVRIGGPG